MEEKGRKEAGDGDGHLLTVQPLQSKEGASENRTKCDVKCHNQTKTVLYFLRRVLTPFERVPN